VLFIVTLAAFAASLINLARETRIALHELTITDEQSRSRSYPAQSARRLPSPRNPTLAPASELSETLRKFGGSMLLRNVPLLAPRLVTSLIC
jgi:hypothetical protein